MGHSGTTRPAGDDLRTAAAAVTRQPRRSSADEKARRPLPTAVVRGPLDDGLKVLLGLLDSDPQRFEAAAVAWHQRWCGELAGLSFAESEEVLTALAAFTGDDPEAAVRCLRDACRTHGLDPVAAVLDDWLEARSAPGARRHSMPEIAPSP